MTEADVRREVTDEPWPVSGKMSSEWNTRFHVTDASGRYGFSLIRDSSTPLSLKRNFMNRTDLDD